MKFEKIEVFYSAIKSNISLHIIEFSFVPVILRSEILQLLHCYCYYSVFFLTFSFSYFFSYLDEIILTCFSCVYFIMLLLRVTRYFVLFSPEWIREITLRVKKRKINEVFSYRRISVRFLWNGRGTRGSSKNHEHSLLTRATKPVSGASLHGFSISH